MSFESVARGFGSMNLVEQRRARLSRGPRKKARRFLQSWVGSLKWSRSFSDLDTFCTFIGYPRSGHSLIGSLLDAHPNAIIADELDALRFLQAGFSRNQVFYLMLRNSRLAAAGGRERTGYHYQVPGQWQGRFERLRVIGDKKGGVTENRLRHDASLLESLPGRLGIKTKFIHVMRNPYDVICTLYKRQRTPLRPAADVFFSLCEAVAQIKSRVPQDVFDLRHETFIDDPKEGLKNLCTFLGLSGADEYYSACASIVYRSPHESRRDIVWPDDLLAAVAARMKQFDFLEGYSF